MPWQNNWYTSGGVHPGPLVLGSSSQNSYAAKRRIGTELSHTTFWTQLSVRFNGRTAQPLGLDYSPGCDEHRHRGANLPVDVDSWGDKPGLSGVAFIPFERWPLPCGTTGSLSPTFVAARLVGLAVKAPLCPLHSYTNDFQPFWWGNLWALPLTTLGATAPANCPPDTVSAIRPRRLEFQIQSGRVSHPAPSTEA